MAVTIRSQLYRDNRDQNFSHTTYLYNRKLDWCLVVHPIWLVWHTYISHWSTDPLNHGAQSIQTKFPGWGSKISWCGMDRDRSERSRSIPLAKRVSRSFKMKDALIKARWRFPGFRRWYQWYCVSCFIHSNLTSITGYFEQTIPRYLPYNFKHLVRIEWRKEHSKFSREIKNHL